MPPIKSKTERQALNNSQSRLVESIISTIEDFMDHSKQDADEGWILETSRFGGDPALQIKQVVSMRYSASGYRVTWIHDSDGGNYVQVSYREDQTFECGLKL